MACCSPSARSGITTADVSVGEHQVLSADKGADRETGSDRAFSGTAAGSDSAAGSGEAGCSGGESDTVRSPSGGDQQHVFPPSLPAHQGLLSFDLIMQVFYFKY